MPDDRDLFDFSEIQIKNLDAEPLTEKMNSIIEQVAKEIGRKIDIALVKEAFRKAAEYDRSYNPATVERHVREEEVRKFAGWLLRKIHESALTRKEIIKELEEYAGNEA